MHPKKTGILPCQEIHKMIERGEIVSSSPVAEGQVQPASIDLRLGHYAYPVSTSFLPGAGVTVADKMRNIDESYEKFRIDLTEGAVLEKGRIYMIPLQESLALPEDVAAFANPKSSTGRLDILTRLIADGSTVFDQLPEGYKGQLYIEIAPRSFSIVVKTGTRLNQLRFRRGNASLESAEWQTLIEDEQVVNGRAHMRIAPEEAGLLRFTVDLAGSGGEGALIGYRARKHAGRIDLENRGYDPLDYWEPIHARKSSSLVLDPDEFYILMTKEAVAAPPDYAAEMVAYDTRAGEFRVHYAGFVDPGFGWDAATGKAGSSRAVLEVRSHEVPFLLEHGQTVGWLRYERMTERPDNLYGQNLNSHYQGQSLKLAKQFR
ncbi:MAG TPA: 2'-deoxycytidine 5'-triphosphate deaminase [Rickettsiales bacterium]|nr:2'-deoxycytidine 5'-triphosphate deaminase [Rickettsiales bacterium]